VFNHALRGGSKRKKSERDTLYKAGVGTPYGGFEVRDGAGGGRSSRSREHQVKSKEGPSPFAVECKKKRNSL